MPDGDQLNQNRRLPVSSGRVEPDPHVERLAMQAHAQSNSASDDPDPTGELPVRVVLVGHTGLELPLRLDPMIELRRVPSALHAIGEAAEPLAGIGGADSVTVILSPETDPKSDADEFLKNLRLVRPGVRVLRLLSSDENSAARDADAVYDGTIRFDTSPDEIRRLVREIHIGVAAPPPPAAEPPPAPTRAVEPPRPAPARVPEAPTPPDASETPLVQAILLGRDMALPALDLIRARTACPDVAFVPGADAGAAGVRVAYHGVEFGHLVAPALPQTTLEAQAAWLGQWLALKQQQDELRRAAFTCEVTGAWNRRYCERFLGSAIAHAAAARQSVTVLCFDIDNFKQYNDRYGHAAGDEILRETVRLLQSVIRPTDRVCRIGGDEFVVIFHEPHGPREPGSKPPASIADIANRFQRQICEHRFPKLAEQARGTLTISGGLATYPWDGRTAEELIERADQLAIQSKLQGKNVITLGPGAIKECGGGES